MAALLELKNTSICFGGLTAVCQVNFTIGSNELVGLIGPNGAGKTTLFNLVTGVYAPTEGEILFENQSIAGRKPFYITRRGIARTFQNIRLFPSLTVLDNVRIGCRLHSTTGLGHSVWRGKKFIQEEERIRDEASQFLALFHLEDHAETQARHLPYGDQRRLEIVRALATRPRLLLLDEPAAGMNPTEKVELMKLIQFIKDKFNIAVLLVEHDMKVVMGICQRVAVLDYGVKIAEGTPEEIRRDRKVIEAYLGE